MPPIYDWECEKCGKHVEINTQSFDDYNKPPEEEESKECKKHEWKKRLGTFKLARGPNWKGSKGNWGR